VPALPRGDGRLASSIRGLRSLGLLLVGRVSRITGGAPRQPFAVFPIKDATCTIFALDPKKPRQVLFFHIEGKPLRSLPIMLAYIRGTTTQTGLVVRARSMRKTYKTKLKVSDREMASLNLERHALCPNWNHTIRPRTQLRPAS